MVYIRNMKLEIRFLEPEVRVETMRAGCYAYSIRKRGDGDLSQFEDFCGGVVTMGILTIRVRVCGWFRVPERYAIYIVKQGRLTTTLSHLLHELTHLVLRTVYRYGEIGALVNRWYDWLCEGFTYWWYSYMPVRKNE